ncbi:MAG: hypothetical protein ACOYB1_09765 [Limnohabitans sp.]
MADNITGFRVDADINPFEQSMRRLVDSARSGQAGVGAALGHLEGIRTLALGIGTAFGAIKFTNMVTGVMDAAGSFKDLSQKSGMTVETLSGLSSVAKLSGTAIDTVTGASNKLALAMASTDADGKGAAAAIKALGLDFKTFQDLSPEDRMLAVSKAMAQYEDGSSKSAIAMALFGKAGAELLPFMADLAEAGDVHAKITTEQAEAADNFGDNLVKLRANSDAWKTTLVMGMAPALSQASGAFVQLFQQSGGLKDQIAKLSEDGSIQRWTRTGVTSLTYLADGLHYVGKIFGSFIAAVGTGLLQISSGFAGLYEGVAKAMMGDFSGASESLKKGFDRSVQYGQEFKAEMSSLWSGDTFGKKMRDAMASQQDAPAGPAKKKPLVFDNSSSAAAKEPSQMPIYEAELAKKIELFEKAAQTEGTLRQFSKAEEAEYWQEVSNRAGISAEDKARAEKKWRDIERGLRTEAFTVEMTDLEQRKQAAQNNFAERITLAEQAHAKTVAMYGADSKEAAAAMGKVLEEKRKQIQQIQQLEDIANQRRRDKALGDVEFDRQDAEHKVAMGLMTQEQLLVQQAQFEERMHAIKLQHLQLAQAAVDPQKDPVKKAEIDAQIEQLELQHQLRMGQIIDQTAQASTANFRGIFSGIESSWTGAIKGMMTGTLTLAQGIKGMFRGVVDAVGGMLAQMVAKWLVQQLMMKVFSKALGQSTVTSEAAKAGAGGVASMAAAPFPLNLSAPAFGAAMSAVAMSFAPVVASASGGFDIPRGINPMTQLHEEEMVLPAHIANPLRDSLAQIPATGQGGDGTAVVIHTTGGDFIHKRDLAKLLTTMKRDYRFQS